ncbi:25476_t:CDS:2, partial [Racocetra persica]
MPTDASEIKDFWPTMLMDYLTEAYNAVELGPVNSLSGSVRLTVYPGVIIVSRV